MGEALQIRRGQPQRDTLAVPRWSWFERLTTYRDRRDCLRKQKTPDASGVFPLTGEEWMVEELCDFKQPTNHPDCSG
ncbi:MAG: hypothetical protein JW395_0872 [Nitrospira sp.]|nr:hypothetical protein [Nitrospira sp.]